MSVSSVGNFVEQEHVQSHGHGMMVRERSTRTRRCEGGIDEIEESVEAMVEGVGTLL